MRAVRVLRAGAGRNSRPPACARGVNSPPIGCKLARQQFGQGGFAVAVLAQQRDAVFRIEAEATGRSGSACPAHSRPGAVHGDQRRAWRRWPRECGSGATCSSGGTSTSAILASIFMRLCAWRALDALALEAVDEGLHVRARRFLLLGEGHVERAAQRRAFRRRCRSRRCRASACRAPDAG